MYRRNDAGEIWTRLSASPLSNPDAIVVGAIVVIQDIDEIKRAEIAAHEREAERAAELAAALGQRTEEVTRAERALAHGERMAAVGTMASGLAHDINNALMPLSAMMDDVLATPGVSPKLRNSLAVLTALVDHLRAMSRNLSLFSRDPEQEGAEGSTDLASWRSRVQALIEASVIGGTGAGGARQISLRYSFAAELPPVRIAPHRLTQAVLNLAHNARDAILAARTHHAGPDDMGSIRLEAEATVDQSLVRLRVVDDGCGMDDTTIRRSVEPFFTTKDQPSAPGMSGSGMGLTLAHAICERVGGRLEIESQQGRGTVVTMVLPAATESAPGTSRGKR
jgi:signal transduction histidine kinase